MIDLTIHSTDAIPDCDIHVLHDEYHRPVTYQIRWLKKEEPTEPPEPPLWERVPWMSQLGPTADFAPGDCGPAALAPWLVYMGHEVTVDEVSQQTGLDRGFSYTMPAHLIFAARYWNVPLYWRRYLDLDDLYSEIDRGQPVVVLVHYPSLVTKYDPNYSRGHWLLVVGYEMDANGETTIIYHDPYWNSDKGARIRISAADFDKAWSDNHLDGNSDRQALRLQSEG